MTQKNKICINARFLTQPLTGVQRYAYNVVKRLPLMRLLTPQKPRSAYVGFSTDQVHIVSRGLNSHLWEQLVLPTAVSREELLWSPGGIGPLMAFKHVLTITDVAIMENYAYYGQIYGYWYRLLWPLAVKRAKKILTISSFSKKEIVRIFRVPEDKVAVTYLGVDSRFKPSPVPRVKATLSQYKLNQPYILTVGALSPRKNFKRLIEAWQRVSDNLANVWLVIVGEAGLSFSNMSSFDSLPARTAHLGRVPDEQLVDLYAGATAFVYPSLYEGFGLPVLEAMAVGCPVLTSNITALPEIVGDAALLVEPDDVDSIAMGIQLLLEDEHLRQELKQKGFERARQFTWDITAERTWQVLCEVANS